jgi:hypothetical protein
MKAIILARVSTKEQEQGPFHCGSAPASCRLLRQKGLKMIKTFD